MKPIDFPQSIKTLQRPSSMSEKECLPLPVWSDGETCISCWKPTVLERIKILVKGKVWLGVYSGDTQPPVFVTADRVFEKKRWGEPVKVFFLKVWITITKLMKFAKGELQHPVKRQLLIMGFVVSLVIGVFEPWIGLVVGFSTGILKELWVTMGYEMPNIKSVIYPPAGALVAYPLAWIINNLIW